MNKTEQSPTPEELQNLENDAVWSLLDEASNQKVSPMFANSIMQQIRSEAAEEVNNVVTPTSFWKRYSLPISAAVVAGIAACVMITLNNESPKAGDIANAASDSEFTDAELAFFADEVLLDELETTAGSSEIDALADQMIAIENADPFIMSADEINILITM